MKHLRKFLLITPLLPLIFTPSFTQKNDSNLFKSPLNIPLYLSGNYGELRSNHFHAGIDLKTGGEIGKPVLAAADGYVSRIKVQVNGYGHSIYITHPNGYTTVYGHLNEYIPVINEYVKSNQYKKHSFEVDLFPPNDMFVFKMGDLIAYSGNTGSSGGPHLHFEIRKTKEEVPMNGLLFKFPIVDVRSPDFRTLFVYSLPEGISIGNNGETRTSYHVSKINNSSFEISKIVKCSTNYIGFATEVYDYLNSSSNRCGIYKLELKVDGNPAYSFTIDNIGFDVTRYINAHMDYDLKVNDGTGIHRLFKLPNNKLPIYSGIPGNGIINIENDSIHSAEITAYDAYNNKSVLRFRFKHVETDEPVVQFDSSMYVQYYQEKKFEISGLKIDIPAYALYRDIYFSLSSVPGTKKDYSDTFNVNLSSEAIQKAITLTFKTDSLDNKKASKLLFGRINGGNKLISEGGDWSKGILSTSTRNFGRYIVTIDTIAPTIHSVNFVNGRKFLPGQQIVFKVTDDFSGITTYNLYIDDKWALLEYDAKNDRMFYIVDKDRLTQGRTYRLKLFVMDEKKNIALFQGKFQY